MRKFLFKFFIILILLLLYIFLSANSYAINMSNEIASSLLRLHVIANSNSQEDQNLKLKVRDALLDYMSKNLFNVSSKEDAIALISQNRDELTKIAKKIINEEGYNYDVSISIENTYFPTKNYYDISLPAGYYDSVRVKIGTASGNNWWCVMFPPLCFTDSSSGALADNGEGYLESSLSEDAYTLISDSSNESVSFKFKILELFSSSNIFTAKK